MLSWLFAKFAPTDGGMTSACQLSITAFLCVMAGTPASSQGVNLTREIELLRARNAEFEREQAAYRTASATSGQSAVEREDYAEFVAGLRRKFLEQCEVVRGVGGEAAIADFQCVRIVPVATDRAIAPTAAVQTEEEKRASVRAKLSTLEDSIDEDLLKRQQEIRQANAQPTGASAAGGGGGTSGQSGANPASSGSGTASAQASGTTSRQSANAAAIGGQAGSRATGTQANAGAAGPNASAAGALPPAPASNAGQHEKASIADGGVGDDIVARQLREAAEKEADPTLREKLWAEYRKYREAKR